MHFKTIKLDGKTCFLSRWVKVKNGSLSEPYTNPGAPVHIITGSAGCQEKHDPWLPKPEITAFRSDDYGYSRLKAQNSSHMEISQVSDDQVYEFFFPALICINLLPYYQISI